MHAMHAMHAMQLTCDVFDCGFTTSRESYLSVHQRVHNGSAVLGCTFPECGAVFAKRSSLVTHECKHTGERPFVCSEPGCAYATTAKTSGTGAYCRISAWLRLRLRVNIKVWSDVAFSDHARLYPAAKEGAEAALALVQR